MKIKLSELKNTVQWIESNTREITISLHIVHGKCHIGTFDKNNREVLIEIFDENSGMLSNITRKEKLEDLLKTKGE